MSRYSKTNPLSGCLLYALATLPFTALVVMGGVWLERLGVWANLWTDWANVVCCFGPCLGLALPLGLLAYFTPLRRGAPLHNLAQMTDRRGLEGLDVCLLAGAVAVVAAMAFLLPPSNAVVYLPAALVVLTVGLRWTVRNLVAIVPFDEQGNGPDLVALGQHSQLTLDDLRDYNLPPPTLQVSLARSGGRLGQLQAGVWRLEVTNVSAQPGKDPAQHMVRLAGTLTNVGSMPHALEPLPKWVLRDSLGREAARRSGGIALLPPSTAAPSTLAASASVNLALVFDVAAAERSFDLLARGRELAPGDEIVVPF
jgi:hypothetical protein